MGEAHRKGHIIRSQSPEGAAHDYILIFHSEKTPSQKDI